MWEILIEGAKILGPIVAAAGATWLWWKHYHENEQTRADQLEARLIKHEQECYQARLRTAEAMESLKETMRDLKAALSEFRGALRVLVTRD